MTQQNNGFSEYSEIHSIMFSEQYDLFKRAVADNLKRLKELDNEGGNVVIFRAESKKTQKIYENLINEIQLPYKFQGFELVIQKDDLFLLHLLREVSESPISIERYNEVKDYFLDDELGMFQLRCSFSAGYNMVVVISRERIYIVTFDEYIENINSFGFGGPSIAIFLKHFLHYEERKISGIDQFLHTYFDDEYKELKLNKRDTYNSLEGKKEVGGKDIKFTEIQKKYPHAKIEFQTYKGNIDKYLISEKFKLKKTK